MYRESVGHIKRGVTERGVFAFACQYIDSPRGLTGNRTVTQMQHPLSLWKEDQIVRRQSLASALSAPRVAVGTHMSLPAVFAYITPFLNVPKREREKSTRNSLKTVLREESQDSHWRRFEIVKTVLTVQ